MSLVFLAIVSFGRILLMIICDSNQHGKADIDCRKSNTAVLLIDIQFLTAISKFIDSCCFIKDFFYKIFVGN